MARQNCKLSILTLNTNGLNSPIKRQRLIEWIIKQDPTICCLQETHLTRKDAKKLKVKGWKKIFHANRREKKAGVAILISDEIDFILTNIKRDREGHFILVKGMIHQEAITIINVYAPNLNAPSYVKQLLTDLREDIDTRTILVGDLNTPLTTMDRSTKQKLNKETTELTQTIEQLDLVDIYRTFYPKATDYTFFSAVHGTFSRIDHMIGHKANLNNFQNISIIPCTLSDHHGMKLEINNSKLPKKYTHSWKLNNMLLNEQWVREEIKDEIKKIYGRALVGVLLPDKTPPGSRPQFPPQLWQALGFYDMK